MGKKKFILTICSLLLAVAAYMASAASALYLEQKKAPPHLIK